MKSKHDQYQENIELLTYYNAQIETLNSQMRDFNTIRQMIDDGATTEDISGHIKGFLKMSHVMKMNFKNRMFRTITDLCNTKDKEGE